MKKTTIRLITDIFLFLSMAGIIGIGLLIKYTLVSGNDRWLKYKTNVDLTFMGMDRHEWGFIHLVIGFVFMGLLVIHLIINWKTVKSLFNNLKADTFVNKAFQIFIVLLGFSLMLVPLFVSPLVTPIDHGRGQHFSSHEQLNSQGVINQTQSKTEVNIEKLENSHKTSGTLIEIKGNMTLQEVSQKYDTPTIFIKKQLNIPNTISDDLKLGHLKKQYGFEMSELREIVTEYINKQ